MRFFGQPRQAVREQRVSVSKAARLVSALTLENAEGLLQFAATHSSKEIDREVVRVKIRRKSDPIDGNEHEC